MALLSRSSVTPVPPVIRIVLVPRSSAAVTPDEPVSGALAAASEPAAPLVQGFAGSEVAGGGTARRAKSGGGEDEQPARSAPSATTAAATGPS
jgi:hypothetical protein